MAPRAIRSSGSPGGNPAIIGERTRRLATVAAVSLLTITALPSRSALACGWLESQFQCDLEEIEHQNRIGALKGVMGAINRARAEELINRPPGTTANNSPTADPPAQPAKAAVPASAQTKFDLLGIAPGMSRDEVARLFDGKCTTQTGELNCDNSPYLIDVFLTSDLPTLLVRAVGAHFKTTLPPDKVIASVSSQFGVTPNKTVQNHKTKYSAGEICEWTIIDKRRRLVLSLTLPSGGDGLYKYYLILTGDDIDAAEQDEIARRFAGKQ